MPQTKEREVEKQRSFHLRLALACGLLLAGAMILLADLVWQNEQIKNLGLLLLIFSAGGYYLQRWRDRQKSRRSSNRPGSEGAQAIASDPAKDAPGGLEKDKGTHE